VSEEGEALPVEGKGMWESHHQPGGNSATAN
jgi:hypothetical protein